MNKLLKLISLFLIINILIIVVFLMLNINLENKSNELKKENDKLQEKSEKVQQEIDDNLYKSKLTYQSKQEVFLKKDKSVFKCGVDFKPGIYYLGSHHELDVKFDDPPVTLTIKQGKKTTKINPDYLPLSDYSYKAGIFNLKQGDTIEISQGSGFSLTLESANIMQKKNIYR